MNARTLRFGTRFASWLLLAAVAASPILAGAEPPGPASVAPPPAADAPQIEHFEYWRSRADAARAVVAVRRARLDEANSAVNRMQRRNHPRGEAREALREEQAHAQAAYDAALHYLEVELPAEASAAGAQSHWLRERS